MAKNFLKLFASYLEENKWPVMPLKAIYMPGEWGKCILEYTKDNSRPVKITDLNKKLRCLFPEIIGSYADDRVLKGKIPWLIATSEVSVSHISMIALNWFKVNWRHGTFNDVDKCRSTFPVQQPYHLPKNWSNDKTLIYDVLPGIFARHFCRKSYIMDINGEEVKISFAHVYFNGVHECMSLPLRKKGTKRYGHFSYVIQLSVITRGGDSNKHLIKVNIGMRRYQEYPVISSRQRTTNCRLNWRVKPSMLVSIGNPLQATENSVQGYSQLKFKRIKNGKNFTGWYASDYLFWDVLMGEDFNPDDVLKEPQRFFHGDKDKGIKALIVHSNQAYNQKGVTVQPGIGMPERYQLVSMFKNECGLQNELSLIPEIHNNMSSDRLPVRVSDEIELTMELWVTMDMYKQVIDVLTAPLKSEKMQVLLQSLGNDSYLLNADKRVVFKIVRRDPDELIKELETIELGYEKAYLKRVNETRNLAGRAGGKTLALVEIDTKESYKDNKDPKLAIRMGMATTGRVTQFIHPLDIGDRLKIKDKPDSRIKNSFLDLLSDSGFFSAAIKKVPFTGHIIAIDILKRRNAKRRVSKYLPVLSWYDGDSLMVKKLGDKTWLPFRESLLQVDKNDVTLEFGDSKRFRSFLVQELERLLVETTGTIYLLVQAAWRYGWWNELTNNNISFEKLPFDNRELPDMHRLRVIRMNTTNDVPQYSIIKDENDSGINKKKGLFKDKEAIYYSVGARPNTMRSRKYETKYNKPNEMLMKQNAVEIIPLGCQDEKERDEIAGMIDKLRRVSITFDASTALPFPMHQFKSIAKYWAIDEDDRDMLQEFEDDVLAGETEE